MIQQPLFDVGQKRQPYQGKLLANSPEEGFASEAQVLQLQLKKLEQQESRQRMINAEIEMLRLQSEEAYESFRRLTLQYNQKIEAYNSKIENRSQDIYDERDKIESNLYYLEQQIMLHDEQCKSKLGERRKMQEESEVYSSKRQHLASLLAKQKMEVQRIIKSNQDIKENIQSTRCEHEKCQEELFELDLRGENLKRYGYQVVPKKIMNLIEAKQAILREIEQLNMRKEVQSKLMGKLVRLEMSERVRGDLQQQKEKRSELMRLNEQNGVLLQENQKLNQIKYAYEWNPNLQIKQLEVNLSEEQKRIAAIEKDIHTVKKKSIEIGQKIKQYKDHYQNAEPNSEMPPTASGIESPRKQKQRRQRREKAKKSRPSLYEQMSNDFLNTRVSKKQNWRDFFQLGGHGQSKSQKVIIDEFTYRVKKSSQKLSVCLMSFFLLGCVIMCHMTLRK